MPTRSKLLHILILTVVIACFLAFQQPALSEPPAPDEGSANNTYGFVELCKSKRSSRHLARTIDAMLLEAGKLYWWNDDCEGAERALLNRDHLDLRGRGITDLRPLEGMQHLRSINLRQNEIQDIDSLRKLSELRAIDLRHNKIRDYSALQVLPHLETVELDHSPQLTAAKCALLGVTSLLLGPSSTNPLDLCH